MLLLVPCLLAAEPVKIESGLVSGVDLDGVHAYLGIPYAAPPTGDLRWRPPQSAKPWSGVLHATKFGLACMQTPLPRAEAMETSEDCLTVNVWTPVAKSNAPLPVMVWIHGGGFRNGGGRLSGRGLVPQGVILVGIQYRLGYFGFYAHPALTEEQRGGELANYGLMDQIAALKWVKRNIAAFGGDPSRVTIFGESAGGSSVLYLMSSPEARGLFARAICESGAGFAEPRQFAEMEKLGVRDAADLGVGEGPAAIAALRKMPAKELMQALDRVRLKHGETTALSTWPALDGKVVTGTNGEIFESGKQAPVPLIIGSNSYEGSLMGPRRTPPLPADQAIRKLYLDEAHGNARLAAAKLFGDGGFEAPSRLLARAMEKVHEPAWLYFFSCVPEKIRGTVPGAAHASEIQFVTGTIVGSEADRRMAERASAFWVRFARTGNPNPPGATQWPAYSATTDRLLEFGDEIAVRTHFRKAQLDYVENLWRKGEIRER